MKPLLVDLRAMSVPARYATIGAAFCGTVAAIVGLIVRLLDSPQTAWFALAEWGIPAALLGALIGLTAAAFVTARRRLRRGQTPSA